MPERIALGIADSLEIHIHSILRKVARKALIACGEYVSTQRIYEYAVESHLGSDCLPIRFLHRHDVTCF